jgi:hypothetical protein
MEFYYRRQTNYGALTDLSKALNEMFGDSSGRTVSHRTAQGVKHVFNAHHMHDDAAEDIVHAGMLGAAALLRSTNEEARATGALLSFVLLVCYQNGK